MEVKRLKTIFTSFIEEALVTPVRVVTSTGHSLTTIITSEYNNCVLHHTIGLKQCHYLTNCCIHGCRKQIDLVRLLNVDQLKSVSV